MEKCKFTQSICNLSSCCRSSVVPRGTNFTEVVGIYVIVSHNNSGERSPLICYAFNVQYMMDSIIRSINLEGRDLFEQTTAAIVQIQ